MTASEKISNHFAGIVTHDISISEQNAHNRLVQDTRAATQIMLKYQVIKIRRLYNDIHNT